MIPFPLPRSLRKQPNHPPFSSPSSYLIVTQLDLQKTWEIQEEIKYAHRHIREGGRTKDVNRVWRVYVDEEGESALRGCGQ